MVCGNDNPLYATLLVMRRSVPPKYLSRKLKGMSFKYPSIVATIADTVLRRESSFPWVLSFPNRRQNPQPPRLPCPGAVNEAHAAGEPAGSPSFQQLRSSRLQRRSKLRTYLPNDPGWQRCVPHDRYPWDGQSWEKGCWPTCGLSVRN
jgi:hypothetical protein